MQNPRTQSTYFDFIKSFLSGFLSVGRCAEVADSENRSNFKQNERVDRVLMALCFMIFAVLGYALIHFLRS
jgi:hypothetical protein